MDDESSNEETRYLDLDGDGVPDAVETVSIGVAGGGDDPMAVEIVDEIDADIDDEGVAHTVAVERIIVSED